MEKSRTLCVNGVGSHLIFIGVTLFNDSFCIWYDVLFLSTYHTIPGNFNSYLRDCLARIYSTVLVFFYHLVLVVKNPKPYIKLNMIFKSIFRVFWMDTMVYKFQQLRLLINPSSWICCMSQSVCEIKLLSQWDMNILYYYD